MEKESKYVANLIKINKELEKPYIKKNKVLKVIGVLVFCLSIVIDLIGIYLGWRAILIGAIPVLGVIGYYVIWVMSVKVYMESIKYSTDYLEDALNTMNLTSEEIDELDDILEKTELGIYTFKLDDTFITFTPNLMVNLSADKTFLHICRVSDVNKISYYTDEEETSFEFSLKREYFFTIDIIGDSKEEGRDTVIHYLSEYYPDIELISTTLDELEEIIKYK